MLQPRFQPPSRVIVPRDCWQWYVEEKTQVEEGFGKSKNLSNRYLNIKSKFKLYVRHFTLDWWWMEVVEMTVLDDHKGVTLRKRVEECLLEWGINHLFTITVDNASSNDWLILYLKGVCKDWKRVVLNNKSLSCRCCAHIVNLFVKRNKDFNILNYWKVPYIISSSKRCACCAYFYSAFRVGF